jgi:hypothetical protein
MDVGVLSLVSRKIVDERWSLYLRPFNCPHCYLIEVMEQVAVRSEEWVLASWLLGSWVRILLKAWMFVRVFLCCVVLCR